MPYATPSSPVPSSSSSITTTLSPRSTHRRARSAFSDEKSGPGAFAPLGTLPRRRPTSTTKKAVFHFSEDDDSPHEQDPADDPMPSQTTSLYPPTNSLRLSMQSGRFSPSVIPPSHIDLSGASSLMPNAVPFPKSSPSTEKQSFLPPSPPHTNSLPRTPSSSIILSNGRPLKPSLKSSSSSPNVADAFTEEGKRGHFRVQSAPSTPRVHFAEKNSGLESVRLFKSTGKPVSVSKPAGEETETETEAENSYPFPLLSPSASFPSSSISMAGSGGSYHQNQILHEIDSTPGITSSVPNPSPSPTANVFVETVTLPRTRPPTLRGTVLVKNLAFEKHVAVRFTLDDWQTTSEVTCKHVVSLPGLPPPFPRSMAARPKTMGDVAASLANGEPLDGQSEDDSNRPAWDRFSFTIRLEDYETKLAERTLFLVARYVSPAGEFWDNNDHANYRVGFKRSATSPLPTPMGTPRTIANTLFATPGVGGSQGNNTGVTSQQRTFSAPSSLKCTPVTGAVARVTVAGQRAEDNESESERTPIEKDVEIGGVVSPVPVPGPLVRRHSAPLNPNENMPHFPTPPPTHFNTVPSMAAGVRSSTQKYISRRLSLSNYVAPGASKDEEKKETTSALATPPTTPPREAQLRDLPDSEEASSPTQLSPLVMIGGMPANAPSAASVPLPSSSSSSSSSSPASSAISSRSSSYADMYPLRVKTNNLAATNTDADDAPFSPTSRTADRSFKMSSLGAQLALSQLASPPVSRQGSQASSPSSSGRNSPRRRESPTRLDADAAFKDEVRRLSPLSMAVSESQVTTPTANDPFPQGPVQLPTSPTASRLDPSDSSYAAFVRQWCFAQSAPPTPGVISTSSGSPGATSGSNTPSPPSSFTNTTAGFGMFGSGPAPRRQQAWPVEPQVGAANGMSSGYGFPGFGFAVGSVSGAMSRQRGVQEVGGEFQTPSSEGLRYGQGIVV